MRIAKTLGAPSPLNAKKEDLGFSDFRILFTPEARERFQEIFRGRILTILAVPAGEKHEMKRLASGAIEEQCPVAHAWLREKIANIADQTDCVFAENPN